MSLLKKASIITTPTAYAEDYLYSIKPAQSLGAEIIPDPNFDTDSTSYWAIATTSGTPRATKSYISNEKFMRLTYDLANGAALNRGGLIVSGKSYKVIFRAKGTANSAFASVGNNGDLGIVISNPTLTTSFQRYEFNITATQTTFRLYLSTSGVNIGDTLDIDNISLKEITDADFDFDRNSTGTRVNEDYLIEDVPYNFTTYSEEIESKTSASSGGGSSITATNNFAIAPNGTLTAGRLQCTAGSNYALKGSIITPTDNGQKFTMSVYIKSNTSSDQNVIFYGRGTQSSANVVVATDRWIRYYFTGTATTNFFSYLGVRTDLSSDSSCDILVWGWQIVKGDQPKEYLKTTDRLDIPRIDYTNGEPSILLEPSRTNLITYSNDFTNAAWTKGNSTITANNTTSPEGLLNASKLTENTATSSHRVEETVTVSNGATVTCSVYAKKGERNFILLFESNSADGAYFNLDTGKFVRVDGTPVDYNIQDLKNGWYRCSIVVTVPSTSCRFQIYMTQTSNTSSYTGDGSSSMFIYGAQVEEGSYATSLIHTSGSAVTRSADSAYNAGNSDLINSTEGVLYVEFKTPEPQPTAQYIAINDGAAGSNQVRIGWLNFKIYIQIRVSGGAFYLFNPSTPTHTEYNKIAVKFKASDHAIYINGQEVDTSTASNIFSSDVLNTLSFSAYTTTGKFYGNVKSVMVFKEALTDLELEKLTGYNNHELYMNYYNRLSYLGLAEEYNVESDINNYIL